MGDIIEISPENIKKGRAGTRKNKYLEEDLA
jgi:hypothetical protein